MRGKVAAALTQEHQGPWGDTGGGTGGHGGKGLIWEQRGSKLEVEEARY
jgi:hypothetical protein